MNNSTAVKYTNATDKGVAVFNIDGLQQEVITSEAKAAPMPVATSMRLAGKIE